MTNTTIKSIPLASLVALFLAGIGGIVNEGYAQSITNGNPSNMTTETAAEFEEIEGNNTMILENDTNIGNTNNSLFNSLERNQEESN